MGEQDEPERQGIFHELDALLRMRTVLSQQRTERRNIALKRVEEANWKQYAIEDCTLRSRARCGPCALSAS